MLIAWQVHDVMVDAFSPHALIHDVVGFMAFVVDDVRLVLVVNELVVFVLVVCVQLYLLLLL